MAHFQKLLGLKTCVQSIDRVDFERRRVNLPETIQAQQTCQGKRLVGVAELRVKS